MRQERFDNMNSPSRGVKLTICDGEKKTSEYQEIERRRLPRNESMQSAILIHPLGYACSCHVTNISPNGLFVRMINPPKCIKGTGVDIVLDPESPITRPMMIRASVVHNEIDGVGLSFENHILDSELAQVSS